MTWHCTCGNTPATASTAACGCPAKRHASRRRRNHLTKWPTSAPARGQRGGETTEKGDTND